MIPKHERSFGSMAVLWQMSQNIPPQIPIFSFFQIPCLENNPIIWRVDHVLTIPSAEWALKSWVSLQIQSYSAESSSSHGNRYPQDFGQEAHLVFCLLLGKAVFFKCPYIGRKQCRLWERPRSYHKLVSLSHQNRCKLESWDFGFRKLLWTSLVFLQECIHYAVEVTKVMVTSGISGQLCVWLLEPS